MNPSIEFVAVQKKIKTLLEAHPSFAGVTILLEDDPEATADQLAAADDVFEKALSTAGVCVVVLSPFAQRIDQVKDARAAALSLDLVTPVAILENDEANRRETGLNKPVLALLEAAMSAILAGGFSYPAQPFLRPEYGQGFKAYYLITERRRVLKSFV